MLSANQNKQPSEVSYQWTISKCSARGKLKPSEIQEVQWSLTRGGQNHVWLRLLSLVSHRWDILIQPLCPNLTMSKEMDIFVIVTSAFSY